MSQQIASYSIIGLLTVLLSLYGYGQKGKPYAKTNGAKAASYAYYPKGHKLTAQERKDYSARFLKQKGVPVLASLPRIEDYKEAKFRNQKEVASKAVVLYGLLYVAHNEKTAKEIIAYFKKYNLWEHVSPEERQYLEKETKTEADHVPVTWRAEALNVLLWALGNFDRLSFPTTMCDFSNYKDLPNLDEDPAVWINKAKLRNTEDILNETDLIYRIHWATREASLNGKPLPAGLSQDIVIERHFVLNWLTMYGDDWDDISTDT